jgi:hypothetical protein
LLTPWLTPTAALDEYRRRRHARRTLLFAMTASVLLKTVAGSSLGRVVPARHKGRPTSDREQKQPDTVAAADVKICG